MSRDGSGTMTTDTKATASAVASSTTVNSIITDIANALTDSINKDGTKAWAANQSVGNNKFTSLGSGSARTDSINYGQVQDGKANWVDGGGTADATLGTGLDHRASYFRGIRTAIDQVDAALHGGDSTADDCSGRTTGFGGLSHGTAETAATGGTSALSQGFGALR